MSVTKSLAPWSCWVRGHWAWSRDKGSRRSGTPWEEPGFAWAEEWAKAKPSPELSPSLEPGDLSHLGEREITEAGDEGVRVRVHEDLQVEGLDLDSSRGDTKVVGRIK